MVARSGRRCAAVDVGGFGAASSRDITPMRHIIRASSPHELAHAVWCRKACFPAHGRNAATFFTHTLAPPFRPTPWGELMGRYHGANC
ncbi:hypothetical protein B9P90_20045 [Citrobacter freundii]|uniref:Uncharacterized protein n=1 Tax=Citrobacter freundii TaxID=546 RepID=A0AA44SJA3_CITFR|nr:hypothetical protein B9P90_20045 [Citrobacter freundii]OYR00910.1 hypothetical protein B9P89_19415 [Citrobacter freundii]